MSATLQTTNDSKQNPTQKIFTIQKEIETILQCIDFQKKTVQVHHFLGGKSKDLPRTAFTLFALSAAKKFLSQEIEDQIKNLASYFEEKSLKESKNQDLIIATCYFARIKKNFGLTIKEIEKSLGLLQGLNLHALYPYPTAMYNFISMCHELNLEDTYPYLWSLRNEYLKLFEYLLFSDKINSWPIFSLAEVNYWQNFLPENQEFLIESKNYLLTRLSKENLRNFYSSGLAKCMEFLSLEQDASRDSISEKILRELNERKLNQIKYIQLLNPILQEGLYLENYHSAHMCLDTNAHLLLAKLSSPDNL